MRKFENLKMVLFDSTKASFKLTVEAQFVRGNKELGYRDLVYVTDRYTGMLNPNIYLTLAYKGENIDPVYTSYPQLFRLREAFGKIKDLVADGSGFLNIDGQITVRPDCQEPVVLSNIGKNNNWISLKLFVIEIEENKIIRYEPGVSIELSTANRYASALTVDEFLTVYTILNDLDLASIQCMMSLAFLDTERNQQQNYYYQQPQQPQYQSWGPMQGNPQPANNNYYYQPQQPMQSNPQPRYNNQQQYQQNSGYSRMQQPQAPKPQPQPQPRQETTQYMRPIQTPQQPQGVPQPQVQQSLPPRDVHKPVMSLDSVDKTQISEITYDDEFGFDEIFNS